jgi:pSer/pThr/pTyr-binding forkhead associated (FHA) protein
VHQNGTRSWQRLETLPLTVGRGLGNDIILDDPYVDARHARIALDDRGSLCIEDLGTLNGLVANDERTRQPVRLHLGIEVRIGRTTLRFRDTEEAVAPALVDDPAESVAVPELTAAHSRVRTSGMGWLETKGGQLLVASVAVWAVAITAWLETSERAGGADAMSAAVGFITLAAVWAGGWALASRAVMQRFHYTAHLAIISGATLAGIAWNAASNWLEFFFPDSAIVALVAGVGFAALLGVLIASHLALASTVSRRRRLEMAGIIVASAVFIGAMASVATEEDFTDVATFSGVLKPIAPGLVPTATVSEFGGVMRELKNDVDKAIKE